ncbi:MAG: glycosyltransferase family 9 protein [Verrucomicrobiaceae bacterium]|nr:glycosyltransferase family 9 protein [Verrucomicrobiaceae bacterium]
MSTDLTQYRSVFVVKPSSLGDIVHTLPVVHLIKQANLSLKVRWIANPEWLPLLKGVDCVDELLEFPRKKLGGLLAPLKYLKWAPNVRLPPHAEPELVLDFQGLARSAFISRARRGAKVLGLSDAREGARFMYDEVVPVDKTAHAVDRYLQMAAALGINPPSREALHWPLPAGHAPDVNLTADFILVHPWSRGKGKSLSNEVLHHLLEQLSPNPVVLVGRTESAVGPLGAHVTDLTNRTSLTQLIWLMRRARWNISVDSGPMHIAAAINDRTLGIHTWSDPRKVGPYNPRSLVWKAGRVAQASSFSPEECTTSAEVTAADVPILIEAMVK